MPWRRAQRCPALQDGTGGMTDPSDPAFALSDGHIHADVTITKGTHIAQVGNVVRLGNLNLHFDQSEGGESVATKITAALAEWRVL